MEVGGGGHEDVDKEGIYGSFHLEAPTTKISMKDIFRANVRYNVVSEAHQYPTLLLFSG